MLLKAHSCHILYKGNVSDIFNSLKGCINQKAETWQIGMQFTPVRAVKKK